MENPYSDNLLQQNRRIKNMKDSFIRHPNLYPINDPNIIPQNKPEIRKSTSNKPVIKHEIRSKRNIFIDMYNYKNKLLESKLSLLPKKFDYVEQDNDFQDVLMLLNNENKITSEDVNKIKFISFAEFKSKLLLSRLNQDFNTKLFFSKNKNFFYKIVNKLYFNKNVGIYNTGNDSKKQRLMPIKENKRSKTKYGGSMLEDSGNRLLSILSV